jgi:hypothetical protein
MSAGQSLSGTDQLMNIGTIYDWVGRVFGITFLLFMLFVLFFPSLRDTADKAEHEGAEWYENSMTQPQRQETQPAAVRDAETGRGTLLIFPVHRRVH